MSGDALSEELQRIPVGTDVEVSLTDPEPMPAGVLNLGWTTSPGDTETLAWSFAAGTYLVDCATEDQIWLPAQVAILGP